MAIQNFISGGYYGKLGDTVGQRWHNKRTIRTYVVPANPNTPAQKSNRQQFATATRLSQIAFNTNKGSPLWDTTEKGQFSQMVSLAKLRLQAGMSEADALPLYPDGYVPNVQITGLQYSYISGTHTHRWTENTYANTEARSYQLIITAYNERNCTWEQITINKNFNNGQYLDFSWVEDQIHSFPTGATIQAVTTDDATHGGSSVEWIPQNFVQDHLPYIYITATWEPLSFAGAGEFQTYINIPLTNREIEFDVTIHAKEAGDPAWSDHEMTVLYAPPDEPGILDFLPGYDYDYPAGSQIVNGSYIFSTASAQIEIDYPALALYPYPTS
jgi:hypothetical protein